MTVKNKNNEFRLVFPLAKSISGGENKIRKTALSDEISKTIVSARMFKDSKPYLAEKTVTHPETGEKVPQFSNIYIEGICSGVAMDLHEEKMMKSALQSMKDSLTEGVDLREVHDQDYTGLTGAVIDLYLVKDKNGIDSLAYKAVLNNPEVDPAARKLLFALESGTIMGVSIGGYILDYIFEHDQDLEKDVLCIKKVLLEEISATTFPAYVFSTAELIKTLKNISMKTKKSSLDPQEAAPNLGDPQESEGVTPVADPEGAPAPEPEADSATVEGTAVADPEPIPETEKTAEAEAPKEEPLVPVEEPKPEEVTPEVSDTQKGMLADHLKNDSWGQKNMLFESIWAVVYGACDLFYWEKGVEDFATIKAEMIELLQTIPDTLDGTVFAKSLESNDSALAKSIVAGDTNFKDRAIKFFERLEAEKSKQGAPKDAPAPQANVEEIVKNALEANDKKWENRLSEVQKTMEDKVATIEKGLSEPADRATATLEKGDEVSPDENGNSEKLFQGKDKAFWENKMKSLGSSNSDIALKIQIKKFFNI